MDAAAAGEEAIGSSTSPFETVQQALDFACDGDTILISPGLYVENVNLTKDNIVLSGYAPELPIDSVASQVRIDGNGNGVALYCSGEHSVIRNLTIQNGLSSYGAGLFFDYGSNHSRVEGCVIRDNVGQGDTRPWNCGEFATLFDRQLRCKARWAEAHCQSIWE